MKILTGITFFILVGLGFVANAIESNNIMVYSTVRSRGSMSIGNQDSYVKTFDVAVANLSDKEIDLSKLCLMAYSPDNEEFYLDTVDEKLNTGILEKGKQVKGVAVFSSENSAIFKAALIKISEHCK